MAKNRKRLESEDIFVPPAAGPDPVPSSPQDLGLRLAAPQYPVTVPRSSDPSLRDVGRELVVEVGEYAVVATARVLDAGSVRGGLVRGVVLDTVGGWINVRWIPKRLERWLLEKAYDVILRYLSGLIRAVVDGLRGPGAPSGPPQISG